jgi:hypothetical protein
VLHKVGKDASGGGAPQAEKKKKKPKAAPERDQGASAPGKGGAGLGLGDADLLAFERQGHIKVPGLVGAAGMDPAQLGAAFAREFKAMEADALRCAQTLRPPLPPSPAAAPFYDAARDRRAARANRQKLRVLGAGVRPATFSVEGLREELEEWCEETGMEVPFLQTFQMHRGASADAREIARLAESPELGRAAAALLGVPSVMLYQTAGFVKSPGDGETAWHSDLNTSPFDRRAPASRRLAACAACAF